MTSINNMKSVVSRIYKVMILAWFFTLIGCASTTTFIEPGTHVLGETMWTATRQEILTAMEGYDYRNLKRSGIADSEIKDGSIAVIRVNCCGGPDERRNAVRFYVPPEIDLEVGDIAEVRVGQPSPFILAVAVGVRQRRDASTTVCRWTPDNEAFWNRVMYCEGIESEGWTQYGAMKGWMKVPEGVDKPRTRITVP